MKAKEMIELINDVELNQHGITKLYPSRVSYFQTIHKYDDTTIGVSYDDEFRVWKAKLEECIGGTIYMPTAKKILNNWFCCAFEQRQALLRLNYRNYQAN
ncbi:hypothetical protein [Clostridium sp. DL1XJH146]